MYRCHRSYHKFITQVVLQLRSFLLTMKGMHAIMLLYKLRYVSVIINEHDDDFLP